LADFWISEIFWSLDTYVNKTHKKSKILEDLEFSGFFNSFFTAIFDVYIC